jgi:hypothetical protein
MMHILHYRLIYIENSGNIANAKLIIFSLMFDDQGDYQCYANSTDSFNSTSSVIKLRVKGWWSTNAVEETGVPGEKHHPVASH